MIEIAKELFSSHKSDKYDYSVSLARIIGMLFIVICHIGNHFNNAVISQVFNVGVPLFFVISGGLIANKEINNPTKWIVGRLVRIYTPLLAFFLYSLTIAVSKGSVQTEGLSLILLFFNLQGLQHLFPWFMSVDGPWFFTIIMLCYFLTIPYKRLEKNHKYMNNISLLGGFLFLMPLVATWLDLSGFFYFISGYIFTKRGFNEKNKKFHNAVPVALVIGSCAIRIGFKHIIDGTIWYNYLVVPMCHVLFAFGVLVSIRWLRSRAPNKFDEIISHGLFRWLDGISVYVYCFHGIFIKGALSVFKLGFEGAEALVMIFLLSFIFSTLMYILFEAMSKRLRKNMNIQ